MMKELTCLLFCVALYECQKTFVVTSDVEYEPKWESLDTRPLPSWYDKAKVGIFLHWGVFSVPSFGSEWFWMNWRGQNISKYVEFMKNYPEKFTYQEFAKDFRAEFWDPKEWAQIFKNAGAKYVVLTSKHHEGYTLWPSKYSYSWNSVDVGPHRDLIGELSKAVRNEDLHFGLYHSLYEWFNPMYLDDKKNKFKRANFVERKVLPEMIELIENYKPDVLWSDGDWETTDAYWQSKEFLAWLYNDSPVKDTIVVNDRWGSGIPCHHGDFYCCQDRFNPGVLQNHKWENAMTIDKSSWGFRRNAKLEDYLTTYEIIKTLLETVSCGGNILVNVGPTKEGLIAPIFQERLRDMGNWLEINGEAIYESRPWSKQNDTIGTTWYTARDKFVYAATLLWPDDNVLQLKSCLDLFNNDVVVQLLGYDHDKELKWKIEGGTVKIELPPKQLVSSDWAWVIKITTSTKFSE